MAATKLSMHMFRNKFSKGGSSARGQQQQQQSSSSSPATIDEEQEHGGNGGGKHGASSHAASASFGLSPNNNNNGGRAGRDGGNGQQQQGHGQQRSSSRGRPQADGGGDRGGPKFKEPGSSSGPKFKEAPTAAMDVDNSSSSRSGSSSLSGSVGHENWGKKAVSGFMKKKGGGGSRGSMTFTPSSQSPHGGTMGSGSSGPGGSAGPSRKKQGGLNRRAVRASAFVADEMGDVASYVPPVVPKPDSSRRLIYNAIRHNVLFRACSNDELGDLIDAFSARKGVQRDSVVIREGAQGDGFYVLSTGSVSVYESTEFKGTLHPGMGFGEIALLYSCPRTATVRAREECDLWFMDRRAFRAIVAKHKRKRLNMKLMLLEKVKIHDKTLGEILKPAEVHSVAIAAQFKEYTQGQVIVRQGDVGDAFYMIERGSVDVYIREKSETHPVVTLKAGSFFGEKALLSSDVRTATCVASAGGPESEVRCLLLMREDFVRMLGDLEYLLERSYEGRDGSDKEKMMMGGMPMGKGDAMVHPTGDKFVKDEFDIKRTLGVGAYGFVKLVRWCRAPASQDDFYYALKCVSKQKIEEKKQQHKIKREEDIMKALVHPFIARCYTVMEDVKGKYFLMEALCGGELCELLYFENKFSEDWSMFYSASVLAAFAHMHERKVAYRDLKPENLVLDNAGYVKIVDFGLAKVIKNGQTYTFCGTPDYLAPEVILSEGHDWAVDYWGLGVLIYEMTEGVAPFYAENPMDTYRKALSGQVHIPDHFTVVVANLIKKLLHTDQSKRLGRTVGGTTAIMCHRWFANFDWDALLDYRMEAPYIPEEKDPDHYSSNDMDGDVEGFASDFL